MNFYDNIYPKTEKTFDIWFIVINDILNLYFFN